MALPSSQKFSCSGFALERGGVLPELTLAYETYGTLAPDRNNAILVCHGYTSSQHAAGDADGWWHDLIGKGKTIDTGRHFVVSANMIGSAYGSTGPASTNPGTGAPYGPDFPEITVGDMVAAQAALLDHLGVGQFGAVVGYSYGGYLTLQWGTTHPKRMRALIVVASGLKGRGTPDMVAALQNRFAECPGWNGGHYYGHAEDGGIRDLLAAIRLETLRSYGVDQGLRDALGDAAEAERRLEEQAREWAADFDANSLIALRKALIGHDISPALPAIEAPLLYVLSRTDTLFPPALAAPAMDLFRRAGIEAAYHEIDSEHGHAAPRTEWHKWSEPLAAFLAKHAG